MNEKIKGLRKLIAAGLGVGFGVFYIFMCKVDPTLKELSSFAMMVEGLPASYMGINWIAKKFGKK